MSLEGKPFLPMRALAQRLLTLEGGAQGARNDPADEAMRVFEHLRVAFGRFAGPDGFTSLVRRALALARADDPLLRQLTVKTDGSFEGLERISDDAVLAIIAHFLGLLVTFVGEPLTFRFVREAWPEATLVDDMEIQGRSHEQ
jgi:hypothetical protein